MKYHCTADCCIKNRAGKCVETDIMSIFARGCQVNIKQKPSELVDFTTAWKAYEEGKTIQSSLEVKFNDTANYRAFTPVEIRGLWQILG